MCHVPWQCWHAAQLWLLFFHFCLPFSLSRRSPSSKIKTEKKNAKRSERRWFLFISKSRNARKVCVFFCCSMKLLLSRSFIRVKIGGNRLPETSKHRKLHSIRYFYIRFASGSCSFVQNWIEFRNNRKAQITKSERAENKLSTEDGNESQKIKWRQTVSSEHTKKKKRWKQKRYASALKRRSEKKLLQIILMWDKRLTEECKHFPILLAFIASADCFGLSFTRSRFRQRKYTPFAIVFGIGNRKRKLFGWHHFHFEPFVPFRNRYRYHRTVNPTCTTE